MTWVPTPLMSGEEIYRNFNEALGAEGISSSAAMVKELAGRHQERAQRIARVRSRMESAWQGTAAGAANRGLGPLATEHDLSGHALHTAQDLTGRQAGSFGDARNAVVPVPPSPGEVDPLVVLTNPGAAATYHQQVGQHNQAAQHNVDVMNAWTDVSQFNTDGQPTSYGGLANDEAGIVVGSPDKIDSEDDSDSGNGAGPRGSAPGPGSGGDHGYREPAGGDGSRPEPSDGGPGTSAGTTRPDSHPVTPSPAGPTTPSPGADSGLGQQPRPAPSGGLVPGVGIGMPVDGRGSGGTCGPRGGAVGGAPRGPVGGPGAGAGQPGAAGRAGPGIAAATGPGRGGVGFGGVPVGAAGRGRGEEDTERKRPDYLEGDDPEELFDTDQLTAPPAIGEGDD